MKDLINFIKKKKQTKIKKIIDKRIKQFENIKTTKDIFKELCFCILTANYKAENSIKIQKHINNKFLTLTEKQLANNLRQVGYRFPNIRAKYIIKARKFKDSLKKTLNSFNDVKLLREYLVKNVTGLGFKEASHFLRNIGYKNLAIIDFHIIDILEKHKLLKRPKTLTKNNYLKIENILEKIAKRSDLNLAELDLYLWHEETGKVLK